MLSDKDKQLFIKAVNIRATMFDEYKRIMTFTQFEQALKEKKEYEVCKNCKWDNECTTQETDAGLKKTWDSLPPEIKEGLPERFVESFSCRRFEPKEEAKNE